MAAHPSKSPSDTMFFLTYTPRADAAARGYEDWLRAVDNPFFNAVPGVVRYENWKIHENKSGVQSFTYFDLMYIDGEDAAEKIWGNLDVAAFVRGWSEQWGRDPRAVDQQVNYHIVLCKELAGQKFGVRSEWAIFLSYVRAHGDARLAGLVLVDNSVGENPPPVWHKSAGPVLPYRVALARFVRGLFHTRQPEAWLARLTRACLRTPEPAARALRAYPVPREDWRAAVLSVRAPVLYLVRPWLAGQAENLRRDRPGTEIALFPHAGHALFIDDPARFDALLAGFARRRVWPARRTRQVAGGR